MRKSAGLMSAERVFNVKGTASTKALRSVPGIFKEEPKKKKKRPDRVRVRVNGDGGSYVFSLFFFVIT